MTRERRTTRAFTLVEVLASVAIVGVLLGLLAPSLGAAREAARAGVCGSNIRQLQIAATLRADAERGAYPPGAKNFAANLHRWHGSRDSTADPFRPEGGALTPYLETGAASRAIRVCPSFEHTAEERRAEGAGFERSAGGYGYNNAFVGVTRTRTGDLWHVSDDRDGAQAARFRHPARTIGFTDAALLTDRLIEYSFAEPRVWPDAPGYAPDPSIHFRHDHAASVAWLDGHVSRDPLGSSEPGWSSEEHAGAHELGWPGAHADNRLFDYD